MMHSAANPNDQPFPSTPAKQVRVNSDAAVRAVRCALQGIAGDYTPGTDVRRALRLMCDEARRHQLGAEQLVIIIKRAWESLPEARRRARNGEREQLLGKILTMCIEEYYTGARVD